MQALQVLEIAQKPDGFGDVMTVSLDPPRPLSPGESSFPRSGCKTAVHDRN
jgi:hypothetical protein